jgi:hypothetical protein
MIIAKELTTTSRHNSAYREIEQFGDLMIFSSAVTGLIADTSLYGVI